MRHAIPYYPFGGGGGEGGKTLSVWMRIGRAKRLHAKEVLHDMLSPAADGGDR